LLSQALEVIHSQSQQADRQSQRTDNQNQRMVAAMENQNQRMYNQSHFSMASLHHAYASASPGTENADLDESQVNEWADEILAGLPVDDGLSSLASPVVRSPRPPPPLAAHLQDLTHLRNAYGETTATETNQEDHTLPATPAPLPSTETGGWLPSGGWFTPFGKRHTLGPKPNTIFQNRYLECH
jgi:hypothetical protein